MAAKQVQNRDQYPVTPDGRYFVVRRRLWRRSNPDLSPDVRQSYVNELMAARRAKAVARRTGDLAEIARSKQAVEASKQALGERGPVWWTDGAKDWNRYLVKNSPYAEWFLHFEDYDRSR